MDNTPTIDATDPRVAQVLALIRAKTGQAPVDAIPTPAQGMVQPAQSTPVAQTPANLSPYAKPGPYLTQLPTAQEQQFQGWVQQNKIPFDPSANSDYDMRGYYKDNVAGAGGAGTKVSAFDGLPHFPDTYKTPYHRSFSNESRYATADAPHWEGDRLIDKSGRVIADETPATSASASNPQSVPPRFNELGAPLQPMNELGAAIPQAPEAAPPPQAPQPGPIKSFLQQLVSGLGGVAHAGTQGALQRLGLPTDYEKQQNALKMGLQQQAQDTNESYRQAMADLATGKASQLDQITAPYSIAKDDQSVLPQFRGSTTTFGGYQALQKLSGTTQGKTDVANINVEGKKDVAQTQADSRERLAQAQLQVRAAIADRNYGLAAQRLKMAGSNLGLRQLEYRLRAYGTGADGKPLPGVEFTADGTPVGTATQTNVRPTTNARNAGERGETMQDIGTRIQGALNDPEIAAGLGPIQGRINDLKGQAGILDGPLAELRNDLVSYGAFQSGLHPVRGIGALQYFDKVMGGLGQTPEQLLAKLASNKATTGSVINVAKGNGGSLTPTPKSGKADFVFIPGKGLVKQ